MKAYTNDFGDTITAIAPVTSVDEDGSRQCDLVVVADGVFSYIRDAAIISDTGSLRDDDGNEILTEAGDAIIFDTIIATVNPVGDSDAFAFVERGGKLYLADSVLRVYDPNTGIVDPVVASAGTIPTGCPLVTVYRDRLVLCGSDHLWYASRQSDPTDWYFGGDMDDPGRAVAGQLEISGKIGEVVNAVIPHNDQALAFAAQNALWTLRGDPVTGQLISVSTEIGVIAPGAWAKSPDGLLSFLSNDGVYLWAVGSSEHPVRFSSERVPTELLNVSPTTNRINMAYDPQGRGFHLFITPATGLGTHWWLDLDNKAMWPVRFADGHQPVAVARYNYDAVGMSETILGCKDGYLRRFSATATTDDSTAIASHILIGPFRVVSDDVTDGLLAEIHGILADNAGTVTWRIVMGNSAEAATDTAVAGIVSVLASETPAGVAASGTWSENRNKVARPRTRGSWAVVWLSSSARWAYEAVAVKIQQLGRLR